MVPCNGIVTDGFCPTELALLASRSSRHQLSMTLDEARLERGSTQRRASSSRWSQSNIGCVMEPDVCARIVAR
jgi:hypothetical protein